MGINDRFRTVADAEADKFDRFSRAVSVITEEHRLSHEGLVYHATHRVAALANSASLDILLDVPANTFPHLRKLMFHLESGPCDIEFFEGTTTSADGTGITVFNRNRNSANTAGTVITHTPTITDDGTRLHDLYSPTGGKDVGSDTLGLGEEWTLAPSTKYLLRLTNNSGAVLDFSLEIMFYEIDWTKAGS